MHLSENEIDEIALTANQTIKAEFEELDEVCWASEITPGHVRHIVKALKIHYYMKTLNFLDDK